MSGAQGNVRRSLRNVRALDRVDRSPGNGTRYRLVLSIHRGSLTVAWPDARWCVGDFSPDFPPSSEWLCSSGGLGTRRADAVAIAAIVQEYLDELAKEAA